MNLNSLESFALEKLLPAQAATLASATTRLTVLERVLTSSGFYSIIKLPANLRGLPDAIELQCKFRLKKLKTTGYFVCWPQADSTLCLEAVINRGHPQSLLTFEQCA
ncbi:MAG: hypothetical protein K2X80_16325 [Pseudomonadaceae bacterium]|jgi:hypothetical protein|nr:hypothetical protein [Pseudomonadaceae bacterium]